MARRALVLTVSDGVAQGTRDDDSGRALGDRLAIIGFSHERWDAGDTCKLGGAPASLAGDELELVFVERTDQDRLEDAVLADRRGQLLDGRGVDDHPGLVWIRDDVVDVDRSDAA